MGQTISNMFDSMMKRKNIKAIILGLESSGKTSILYKFKKDSQVAITPTKDYNIETLNFDYIKFTILDLGGNQKNRKIWRHYYKNVQAVIFVVDCSRRDLMEQTKIELWKIISEDELRHLPLLIFCNKIETGMMSIPQITEDLQLTNIRGREWFVQGSCGLNGDGIFEGFDWLAKALKTFP